MPPPGRHSTAVRAVYDAAIAEEAEYLQKRVAALTEELVALTTQAAVAKEFELRQQEGVAKTQREAELLGQEVVAATEKLATLVRPAAATTKDVKLLQEQVANLARQFVALAAPAPQQATSAAATTKEAKLLQEQVVALTEQLAALALPALPPSDVGSDDDNQYQAAMAKEVEILQKLVAASTEELVHALTRQAVMTKEVELLQQEIVARAQEEAELLGKQVVDITERLATLVRRAAVTTKDVNLLQEQAANFTQQLAALAASAPQQAMLAAATAEEAKNLQEQVIALTQQLAALAMPGLPPSDVESDDDQQYQAESEHIPTEPENHTWKCQSVPTQPNNVAGISNFVKTIKTIFKKKRIDVPISIFKLPNSITSDKPEAYAPKLVGLGPLHHLRPELQHLQMYKVMEAKRIHDGFKSDLDLDKVIEYIKQLKGPSIRASYSIYLDMVDDDLAGVMAIDGLFLLDFLCFYGIASKEVKSSYFSHLVNSAGRRLPQNAIIQEAIMLENQIPVFVLVVILITECSEFEGQMMILRELLPKILIGFCESFSPLKTVENYPRYLALQHAHLLDLLYHLVILKESPEWNSQEEDNERKSLEKLSEKVRPPKTHLDHVKMLRYDPWEGVTSRELVDNVLEAAEEFAPVQFQQPIKLVRSFFNEIPRMRSIISAPAEEVPAKKTFLFPTASELDKVGVKFSNRAAHITDIKFDQNTFHLPAIKIEANFEVIMRNLVAYETMIKSEKEPPILNWYVELMNGLIETAEDVGVLMDQGIISKPEFIDEEQVAKIFNGMNKSVELINIPENLNNAIKSVKDHYIREKKALEDTLMGKCRRTVKRWFRVFAVLLALFLLTVQTVCSVYECPRFSFKTSNASPVRQVVPLPSLRSHLL